MINIVYYDGNDKNKQQLVKGVLDMFPITYKLLTSEDLPQTIGYVMELDGCTKHADDPATPISTSDLMIIQDLDDDRIQAISFALREANAHVARKAMLTKHNRTWTLASLLQEIEEEHQYFMMYDHLKQLLMEVNNMEETAYTPASWKVYQDAFLQGYLLFQEQQPDKALLAYAIQMITEAKANLQSI